MSRFDIRTLLYNPVPRRELFVQVIIATQAREGVVTTRKQAEQAYDAVSRLREQRTNGGTDGLDDSGVQG